MRFELTDEQKLVQKMVRDFSQAEVAPRAAEIDRTEEFPFQAIKKLGELGLMGIPIPTEYGGGGADSVCYTLALEELSRACSTTGLVVAVHTSVGTWPILHFGTEEQKQKFVVPLAKGEKLGAFALTEADAGSDPGGMVSTASLDGEEWVINGRKIFITNASAADVITVMAITDKSAGPRGISAFIVEKGTPGFTTGAPEKKMGVRASDTRELIFEECRIPKESLLGKLGGGLKIALSALDVGRVGIAAQATGIAQAALDASIEYSKQREQFGKPISKFQAIQWMLADMTTKIEAARLLTHQAAWRKDAGLPNGREAAIAKLFASDTAMWVTNKAIQIHGGYGYSSEYPVERLFRDAKVTQIYEGSNEIQRIVISRAALG